MYADSAAQHVLSVDLSKEIRPVTHCASGSLYGMTESLPLDIKNLVAPLKPRMFCQPPRGAAGDQHPYGSAIAVSERLVSTTGTVQITLADLLPYWPYQWPGKTKWLAMVQSVIEAKKASGRSNYHSYTIWNEPGITWQAANGNFYTECWKPTYDLIRSLDPTAKICGPGEAYYSETMTREFFTFCKNNNCMPELFSWHQCGVSSFVDNYNNFRQLEKSMGISPRQICINEYSSRVNDQYEGCPGYAVPFIAKFERYGIESACISWWHTQYPGRLGSLLTPSNEKGGGWYLYKWYGDMSGNMVQVVPPNDRSDGIDGFGCIDRTQQYASICIGGNGTGTVNVAVNGIPASFGAQVNVQLEYVTWENKDAPVAGTKTISTSQYTVTGGSINVPVYVSSHLYAYRVHITPVHTVIPPVLSFKSPAGNAAFAAPATIPFEVSAEDTDGTVAHVNFYSNGSSVSFHEEWVAPYLFNWNNVAAGNYQIVAVAYDNDGNTAKDTIMLKVNVAQAPYGGTPHPVPGTIQLEEFDHGGNGYAYADTDKGTNVVPAPGFRADEDVDIELCGDAGGGHNIGYAAAGEWLEYTVQVGKAGLYTLVLRAACEGEGRTISLASGDTPLAENIPIPNTGGWQTWTDVAVPGIQLSAGVQVLRLTVGSAAYVNLNYMSLAADFAPAEPLQLYKGWNLVGCSVAGITPVETALASIWTELEDIKDADGFWNKSQPAHLNTLKTMQFGKGYIIKVGKDCLLKW